ncbi:MAG: hypothetical protein ACRECV_09215 [Xanthobacteraceae bacterium]
MPTRRAGGLVVLNALLGALLRAAPLLAASGLAALGAGAFPLAALNVVAPAAAQEMPQPKLNPEDEFAPAQLKQPMPARVAEPTAKPEAKPDQRNAAAKPGTRTGPARAPHADSFRTAIACSGPFAKDSGMLALAVTYDSRNMIFTHETVQGAEVGVTVLFPKDPRRRLEVWWRNPNRTGLYLIDIAGRSIWSAPKGLRLGLSLEQLERLNRKPFTLSGFDDKDVASVADWNGGELASLPGGCKAGVSLHAKVKKADAKLLAKDHYSSNDPAVRALKPSVSEILIGY